MAVAATDIAGVFGEAGTYTPAGGVAVAVTDAVFCEHTAATAPADDGMATGRTATVTIAAADVAVPDRLDVYTHTATGEEWVVDAVTPVAGGARWHLELVRSELAERSKPGFRMERQ